MKGISSLLDQIVSQPQVQTAIVTFDGEIDLLLRFEPKNPRPGLHRVRVRLRQPGQRVCVVLARRSYWVEDSEKAPQ